MKKMRAVFAAGGGLQHSFVDHPNPFLTHLCAALLLASVLNPILSRIWVENYTGNANFVLATCIAHALALTTATVDLVGGSLPLGYAG